MEMPTIKIKPANNISRQFRGDEGGFIMGGAHYNKGPIPWNLRNFQNFPLASGSRTKKVQAYVELHLELAECSPQRIAVSAALYVGSFLYVGFSRGGPGLAGSSILNVFRRSLPPLHHLNGNGFGHSHRGLFFAFLGAILRQARSSNHPSWPHSGIAPLFTLFE